MKQRPYIPRFVFAVCALAVLAGCKSEDDCVAEIISDLDAAMDAANAVQPVDLDLRFETRDRVNAAKINLRGIASDKNRDACDYYVFGASLLRK